MHTRGVTLTYDYLPTTRWFQHATGAHYAVEWFFGPTRHVVTVDTEFTAPVLGIRRVVEFGWTYHNGAYGSFLINPGPVLPFTRSVQDWARRNGVDLDTVPTFPEMASNIIMILSNYLIVGWNPGNDIAGIRSELKSAGRPYGHTPWVDLREFTRLVEKVQAARNHTSAPDGTGDLREACERWGVPDLHCIPWHTASGDSRATMALLGQVLHAALELGLSAHDMDVCKSRLGTKWEDEATRDWLRTDKPPVSRDPDPRSFARTGTTG